MKKNNFFLRSSFAILCGLLFIISCGIYTEISISADNTINYTSYKTFAWLPDGIDSSNTPYNNEIIRSNVKNYFGQSFAERGYTVNLNSPDVLLKVVISNKNREQKTVSQPQPNLYYDCNYYYCSVYYSPNQFDYYYENSFNYCYSNGNCNKTIQYTEGSITLNVIDRKLNKLIWSGTAKGDIYEPSSINSDIHPAVIRIMKKYPVPIKNKVNKTNTGEIYSLKNTN